MTIRMLNPEQMQLLDLAAEAGIVHHAFTSEALREIDALMAWGGGARYIAVLCALGRYADRKYHAREHRQVMGALRAEGLRWPSGKRSSPALDAFVRDISAVALAHGVLVATGDNATLVRLLRCVAERIGLRGDVRSALRRAARRA